MIEVRRLPRSAVGYERIPNSAIRSADLSLAALGLLARLLADGDHFDSIDAIADAYSQVEPGERRKHGRGRDAYRKAAAELDAAGYLVRVEQQGAGSRVQTTVTAVPAKAQVKATAEITSRPSPARTGNGAGQPRDGHSVAGATSGNSASAHVGPVTGIPLWQSPAETTLSAGQPRDGVSGPALYMHTVFQTSDLPTCGPADADEGQAGEMTTTNSTADAEMVEPVSDVPTVEGSNGSDVGKPMPDSASASGSQDAAAVHVLGAMDFGRSLTPDERERLTGRLRVLLAGGWTAGALVRELGDLGGARKPVAVFASKAKALPETAPVVPEPKRAPTAAEALAASEAAAAADRDAELTDADRDAARALLDQIRAKRAQSAPESAGGAVGPGGATERREALAGASARAS